MKVVQCIAAAFIASLVLTAPMLRAQPPQENMFDRQGYLAACSSRVSNGAMLVPMRRLCDSTSTKLCNLSLEMRGRGDCMVFGSFWLEQDSPRVKQQYIGAQTMAETSSAFQNRQVADLTSTQIGAYQTALLKWFKLRVVELDQTTRTR